MERYGLCRAQRRGSDAQQGPGQGGTGAGAGTGLRTSGLGPWGSGPVCDRDDPHEVCRQSGGVGRGVVRETARTRPEAREHHSEHPHRFEDLGLLGFEEYRLNQNPVAPNGIRMAAVTARRPGGRGETPIDPFGQTAAVTDGWDRRYR